MSNPGVPQIVCGKCKAAIDASDNYCRRCGTPTTGRAGSAAWWDSPWLVLVLLFLVLGPFALPMLWRSRRFTPLWKMVLTLMVLGVTVYAFWQIGHIFNQAMKPLLDLGKSGGF